MALFLLTLSLCTLADEVLPLGYGDLGYDPPEPGTYDLPVLFDAADGSVVRSDGSAIGLHEVFGDGLVLLSFIYSSCSDSAGCPLSTAVFHRIGKRLEREPQIARGLRLATLSFDPDHDTPEVIRDYGEGLRRPGVDWRFLTTASEQDLAPILVAYNQSVVKDRNEQGEAAGTFSHILRVYLIDDRRRIRNIYSVSFLHPDLLVNDVKTLLLEKDRAQVAKAASDPAREPVFALSGAGDYKDGYAQADYETRSRSLAARQGQATDLIGLVRSPPLGLPLVPIPADSPITKAKVDLGRKLFYDRRLSLNNTFSCAMCHIPDQGFTNNEIATAVGFEGRTVRRNAPTVFNTAYLTRLFHDGREHSLEQQIWGPLLAANQMANPLVGAVIEKLRGLSDYQGLFEAAFDGRGPGLETLGMAFASYQRTLVSGGSAFDRWLFGGEQDALSELAQRGLRLFTDKGGCVSCHSIGPEAALFTDNGLHNPGIGYRESMQSEPADQAVTVAPGVVLKVPGSVIGWCPSVLPTTSGCTRSPRTQLTGGNTGRPRCAT